MRARGRRTPTIEEAVRALNTESVCASNSCANCARATLHFRSNIQLQSKTKSATVSQNFAHHVVDTRQCIRAHSFVSETNQGEQLRRREVWSRTKSCVVDVILEQIGKHGVTDPSPSQARACAPRYLHINMVESFGLQVCAMVLQ